MKILIDADACPVKDDIIDIAGEAGLIVYVIKSYSHFSHEEVPEFVEVKYVDKGADMADFEIVRLAEAGDLIITQDYGLASLLLPKGCHVMHHKGFMYSKHNMDRLLESRYQGQMARRAGIRTKGPKAFTKEDREKFRLFFTEMLGKILS